MQGVDYDIQSYLYDTRKAPKDTVWYQKIDSYINELSRFALMGTITAKTVGLLIMAFIIQVDSVHSIVQERKGYKL